jgi:hypothetical protein
MWINRGAKDDPDTKIILTTAFANLPRFPSSILIWLQSNYIRSNWTDGSRLLILLMILILFTLEGINTFLIAMWKRHSSRSSTLEHKDIMGTLAHSSVFAIVTWFSIYLWYVVRVWIHSTQGWSYEQQWGSFDYPKNIV